MFQMKYRMSRESLALSVLFAAVAFTPASLLRAQGHSPTKDILYIGDGENTVKRFDAASGKYLGPFLTPPNNGVHAPQGIIIDDERMRCVRQTPSDNSLAFISVCRFERKILPMRDAGACPKVS